MNSIVSLPIAAAVPVASPSIASPMSDKPSSLEAELARFEQAVNVLRTRHVCEGWTMDEAAAERALSYFRKGCPDDDEEWGATLYFMASHGLSFEWIHYGDPSVMIAQSASLSRQAAAADPIFAAIDSHKRAFTAYDVEMPRTDELEEAIPSNRRQTTTAELDNPAEDDDPQWVQHQRELHRLREAESEAECVLASVVPTTLQGIAALLQYAAEVERRGAGWPTDLVDPDDEKTKFGRSWYYFVHRNLVESLQTLAA
ncbi:hypothetical protein [Bradyrhizobium retamae]|uniref:Uncharacterized protein n=1 Tax=Bradyrhizobium retamae TaxID=1300035 RepID=A0A0R3MJE8_9BRAD|nr:hypothetical protein [Bradyrhizobium retamae]KRR20377.1 hypothetical protein CQ13_32555 [Bradyrhizobium retamae]